MADEYRIVSKNKFYELMGPLNVHPRPKGEWPYVSDFVTPDGRILGIATPAPFSTTTDSGRFHYRVHESLLEAV